MALKKKYYFNLNAIVMQMKVIAAEQKYFVE